MPIYILFIKILPKLFVQFINYYDTIEIVQILVKALSVLNHFNLRQIKNLKKNFNRNLLDAIKAHFLIWVYPT